MGVAPGARNRHIGHWCIDEIVVSICSIHMDENAIGSESLAGMAGYGVAVIEMLLLFGRKLVYLNPGELAFSFRSAVQWFPVPSWQYPRGIVQQHVDDCKTEGSARTFALASDLLARLKAWKQASQLRDTEDWIFASPFNIRRLPYSYTSTRQELVRASNAAGMGHISTHAFRHTYRSWLDSVGTPIAIQQKMMRHSDIRTTMNMYGDVVTDEKSTASFKVAELAFCGNGAQNGARIQLTY
jgi:hypothetical protein